MDEVTEEAKFNLRIPKGLYRWLKQFAKSQHRSVNAQIVALVEEERQRQQVKAVEPPSAPADDDQV
ncbi:MAG: Arc family DNA-binding protein [Chloroflexota bacterium]|nr:Arc family DNA-binding protein [Chloroflexota bacterium]